MRIGLLVLFLQVSSVVFSQPVEAILPFPADSIDKVRNRISAALFGDEEIPSFKLISRELRPNAPSSTYSVPNLGSMTKGYVQLKHNFISKIYILEPKEQNNLNMAVIYHSGHGYGVFREDEIVNYNSGEDWPIRTMDFFLSKGFTVIGVDMPFFGENRWPDQVTERGITHPMYGHNSMFNLENPFYYFLAPVKSVIDYIQSSRGWDEFIMFGLSGGGWTTTLYSAIDPRIKLSFPVAGSIPVPLRTHPRDFGDMEQNFAPFCDKFNYTTLYFLGAAGERRKQYQVLIKKDHCCFAFDGKDYWVDQVNDELKTRNLPGTFEFLYDTFATSHRISSVAIDSIHSQVIQFAEQKKYHMITTLQRSKLNTMLCDNESMQLSVNDFGIADVRWFKNGEQIADSVLRHLTVEEPGKYHARIQNISGAVFYSDTVEVNKQLRLEKPIISRTGNRLGTSLQGLHEWYLNGEKLRGKAGAEIDITRPGRYSVRIIASPCYSDFSDTFDVGVTVFPNPSSNFIKVRTPTGTGQTTYELKTLSGTTIASGTFSSETTIVFKNKPTRGMYLLYLTNGSGFRTVEKISIQY